jgi:deoxycytidine triphosphate deaminase
MPTFPSDFNESWLWVDPAAPDPATHYGAVLLAEEIRNYVDNYNLLFDRSSFKVENLKGASYTMSPHPTEGWIIHDRGAIKNAISKGIVFVGGNHERLRRKENSRGPYYIVPPNSLAYIRLNEILRLPFYVIGRHNLKIDYVYQGLLLGTGPQVDPGFIGQIYIPLHNLTNRQVEVYINESFVSIDFVRTSPLPLNNGTPTTYEAFYELYKDAKRLIKPEKIDKKRDLDSYLQGARPSSSLGDLVPRVERIAADVKSRRFS